MTDERTVISYLIWHVFVRWKMCNLWPMIILMHTRLDLQKEVRHSRWYVKSAIYQVQDGRLLIDKELELRNY
ncbi:unnamed protein product [Victoria cruziana]